MAEQKGILIKAIAGFYYIEAGSYVFECKARGVFRKQNITPVVGDTVLFTALDEKNGILESILPRKNCLIRPPISNIDRLFIVSAQNTPAPSALMIDRLTAIAAQNDIEPIIVFNKSDMGDLSRWKDIYTRSGFKTIVTSVKTGQGCDEISELLNGKISAFTGNSGVGKSSILNYILPQLNLKTGEVSEKLGRGRHTTRHIELYKAFGGYVADTPGFSSLDIERAMPLKKEDLAFDFPDFSNYLGKCKFTSCTHTGEKGCAVFRAAEDGNICPSRLKSYCMLYNEIKDIKQWK